jgi:hypothetical protein
LPTPFQLTGDARWDKEGDLYGQYDLGFEEDQVDSVFDEVEKSPTEEKAPLDLFDMASPKDTEDEKSGVKVLSENVEPENKNMDTEDQEKSAVSEDDLFKTFQDCLSTDKTPGGAQECDAEKHRHIPDGILPV